MDKIASLIGNDDFLYGVLSAALSRNEGEKLVRNHYVTNNEGDTCCINYFFPNGCSKLRFRANTAIIYKPWLNYSDAHKIGWLSDLGYSELIVVVDDPDSIGDKEVLGNVILLSFNDAVPKFSKVCPDYSSMAPHLNLGNTVRFCQSVKKNKVTIFIGAGVSQSLGLPSWRELLKRVYLIKSHAKKAPNEYNCSDIVFARYIGYNSAPLTPYVKEALYESISNDNALPQSSLINSICHLIKVVNIDSIITYNYDILLERHLLLNGINCYPIYSNVRNDLNRIPVYHVHGILSNSSEFPSSNTIILSEKEYHEMYSNPYLWSNVEQLHALSRNTCLFFGLSMTDPNLRRLIDAVYGIKAGSSPEKEHFAFLPMIASEPDRITQYTLESMGVNVLWYSPLDNTHQELPELIEFLIQKIK